MLSNRYQIVIKFICNCYQIVVESPTKLLSKCCDHDDDDDDEEVEEDEDDNN